jgi:hemerythrin-like domain-containing protein
MATFADTAMMSRLVDSIDRHADAIHHSVEANQKQRDDRIAQQLEDLVSKLNGRS